MARPASASRTLHRLLALSALVIVLAASWWLWSPKFRSWTQKFRPCSAVRFNRVNDLARFWEGFRKSSVVSRRNAIVAY